MSWVLFVCRRFDSESCDVLRLMSIDVAGECCLKWQESFATTNGRVSEVNE